MWMRFLQRLELVLEPVGHDLEPEVEEVPEDRLQIETLGPADLGVLGRDQARQVDDEVGLERRVLEEIRHHHLADRRPSSAPARSARRRSTRPSRRASGGSLRESTTSAMRSTSAALFTVYGMLVT